MASPPNWTWVLATYARGVRLYTLARRVPFDVVTVGDHLVVTPTTGRERKIRSNDLAAHWDDAVADAPESTWHHPTRNSSYHKAIAADLDRRRRS